MKMLLLLICFISTSVFAGEPKKRGAGIKDATGKNSNYFSRGLHNNGVKRTKIRKNSAKSQVILDTQAPTGIKQKQKRITGNKESSMHQGAMNSVRPKKPGSKKPACSLHDSVHC